jgi:hypothetical protein
MLLQYVTVVKPDGRRNRPEAAARAAQRHCRRLAPSVIEIALGSIILA